MAVARGTMRANSVQLRTLDRHVHADRQPDRRFMRAQPIHGALDLLADREDANRLQSYDEVRVQRGRQRGAGLRPERPGALAWLDSRGLRLPYTAT